MIAMITGIIIGIVIGAIVIIVILKLFTEGFWGSWLG